MDDAKLIENAGDEIGGAQGMSPGHFNLRYQALMMAAGRDGEPTQITLDRAQAYMDFITGKPSAA